MYEVERPSDEQIERLARKYTRVRRRIVHWDQRHVDFRREMEDPKSFGEVVLLIHNEAGRIALVRGRGSSPDAFDLPTGTIEEGEAIEEVAMREAHEETGREVRLEGLVAIYQVRVRWKTWDLERWFFVFRCLAISESGTPQDSEEIEEVKFIYVPDEMPPSWSRNEWWGGRWRKQILEAGGVLSTRTP